MGIILFALCSSKIRCLRAKSLEPTCHPFAIVPGAPRSPSSTWSWADCKNRRRVRDLHGRNARAEDALQAKDLYHPEQLLINAVAQGVREPSHHHRIRPRVGDDKKDDCYGDDNVRFTPLFAFSRRSLRWSSPIRKGLSDSGACLFECAPGMSSPLDRRSPRRSRRNLTCQR